jgi:hypothetical protein
VAHAKRVVLVFVARRERRQPAALLDAVEAIAPPGEHLVWIGLVAHVPHEPVVRRVEDAVQCHGEFHRAEAGAEMSAARGHAADQVLAQFGADCAEPVLRLGAQVGGQVHCAEQWKVFEANGHCVQEFTRESMGQDAFAVSWRVPRGIGRTRADSRNARPRRQVQQSRGRVARRL